MRLPSTGRSDWSRRITPGPAIRTWTGDRLGLPRCPHRPARDGGDGWRCRPCGRRHAPPRSSTRAQSPSGARPCRLCWQFRAACSIHRRKPAIFFGHGAPPSVSSPATTFPSRGFTTHEVQPGATNARISPWNPLIDRRYRSVSSGYWRNSIADERNRCAVFRNRFVRHRG